MNRYNSTFKAKSYGFKRKKYEPLKRSRLARGGRLKAGRKTKAWNAERRKLKADSARNNRTTCELRGNPEVPHECSTDDFLGYAHAAKRRNLSRVELGHAILICNNAHNVIEFWPAEEMKRIVNETIEARAAA